MLHTEPKLFVCTMSGIKKQNLTKLIISKKFKFLRAGQVCNRSILTKNVRARMPKFFPKNFFEIFKENLEKEIL